MSKITSKIEALQKEVSQELDTERTLAFVNGIRALKSANPLSALPRNKQDGGIRMRTCPVATALTDLSGLPREQGGAVEVRFDTILIDGQRIPTPDYVGRTIIRLDDDLKAQAEKPPKLAQLPPISFSFDTNY